MIPVTALLSARHVILILICWVPVKLISLASRSLQDLVKESQLICEAMETTATAFCVNVQHSVEAAGMLSAKCGKKHPGESRQMLREKVSGATFA